MEHSLDIQQHQTIMNGSVSAVFETDLENVSGDIGLRIKRSPPDEGQFDFVLLGPLIRSAGFYLSGMSKKTSNEFFGAVHECRTAWTETVIDLQRSVSRNDKSVTERSFLERWDFREEPGLLESLVPKLALAGDKLFLSVFLDDGDDNLKKVAETLRTHLRRELYIAVTSDSLFLPWSMLYTHPVENEQLLPDGSNWKKEGFWGYQHIIQHSPENFDFQNEIQPNAAGEVALSVNVDAGLPISLKLPSIEQHFESVSALAGTASILRKTREELATVLTGKRDSLERIVYFYCHGHGTDGAAILTAPYLQLSDGSFSASDLKYWAKGAKLPTQPLVFINACQGGQMTTIFYESFANELLKEGAVGLLGAQIDVPAVFASAYGQMLLEDFFSRDKGRVRLGPLMRKINRRMWDCHNNPLGLVYSLYRGVDCFINWPTAGLPKRTKRYRARNALRRHP